MEDINITLLGKLYSKRKHLLIIMLLAGVVGFIITLPFVIKPKYRSLAYVYPANMVPFFMEQETHSFSHSELLIQFLSSNDVKNEVNHKLNLARHYNLDTLSPKYQVYFDDIFERHVRFSLTRFESAEISVLDVNPDTAKLIASTIIEIVNKKILYQHEQKFKEYIAVNKVYVDAHKRSLDSLKSTLQELGKKYGVIDVESQSREAYRNYYKLLAEGKENIKLNEAVSNLNEHSAEFTALNTALQAEASEYSKALDNYNQSLRDYNRKLSYTIIASAPTFPIDTYYPKKGVVVPICMASALLLSVLYFIYFEKLRQVFQTIRSIEQK